VNFTVHVGKTLVFTYKQFVEMNKLKDEPKIRRESKKKKRNKRREALESSREEDTEDSAERSGREHRSATRENVSFTEGEGVLEDLAVFECGGVPVCGDVKIDFERQGSRIFMFWFNTCFVKGTKVKKENKHQKNHIPIQIKKRRKRQGRSDPPFFSFSFLILSFSKLELNLVIYKKGLDKGHKDKHHKLYEEAFRVEAVFTELSEDVPRKFSKADSTPIPPYSLIPSLLPRDHGLQDSDAEFSD
jgi:hypothetical protein